MTYAEMAALYPEMESVLAVCIYKKRRLDDLAWAPTSSASFSYTIAHPDPVFAVYVSERIDGVSVEYTEKESIAEVEAAAESWYWDPDDKALYVHTTGGLDPGGSAYYVMSIVEERVATHETVIDGKPYQGVINSSSLPDIVSEIGSLEQGGVIQSFGAIVINNDGKYDTDLVDYIYEAAKVDVYLVGMARGITSDPSVLWSGWTGPVEWTEVQIIVEVRDLRDKTE